MSQQSRREPFAVHVPKHYPRRSEKRYRRAHHSVKRRQRRRYRHAAKLAIQLQDYDFPGMKGYVFP